jgi:uncharacterized protein
MDALRIAVRELEDGPQSLQASVSPADLNLDEGQIQVSAEVLVRLTAEKQSRGGVRIKGKLAVDMQLTCVRCLDLLPYSLAADFNQYYQSNAHHSLIGEISLQEKDTEVGFFSGGFIDVSDIIREQILLGLPMKPLCREGCRGLCPDCGKNRNRDRCSCRPVAVDPRLAPLLKFKSQVP